MCRPYAQGCSGGIWEILRDIAEDERRTLTENVMLGSALGDFSLPQQRDLHAMLLDACEKSRGDWITLASLRWPTGVVPQQSHF